ncbi:MAG: response regulator [Sutterella sp.]|nr:response regulator [Sutterella sp.]
MTKILIVEDETAIRELVAFVCEADGMTAVKAADLAQARAALASGRPDLMLLDVMLPDGSGFDLLRAVKQSSDLRDLPVIMLTARGDEADRVAGLDGGADDYVVKPFLPRELTARIRAVLRRSSGGVRPAREERDRVIVHGPLSMNETRFEATVDGKPLKLSVKEFRLLFLFASRPGRVFTREQLLDSVWGSAFVDERTVDVHMLRLRKALAGTRAEDIVETVRGIGYRCRADV